MSEIQEKSKELIKKPIPIKRNFIIDTWKDIENQEIQIKELDSPCSLDEVQPPLEEYILSKEDKEAIRQAFYKFDKKKAGFVQIDYVPDIFRYAGQNPSLKLSEKLIQESNRQGYGVIFLNELIILFQKHWKSNKYATSELKMAIKTLSTLSLIMYEI